MFSFKLQRRRVAFEGASVRRTFKCLRIARPWAGARWLFIACVCAVVGCSQEETIRQYTVPKQSTLAAGGESSEPREILAAIVPKGSSVWFFKVIDTPAKVAQYESELRQLVETLTFNDEDKPQWQLPKDWREEAGGQFVYSNLRPPGEDNFRIAVSELPMPSAMDEAAWKDFMVINVNRWRGQLQLDNQAWDAIAKDLEPIEKHSSGKATAYYARLLGTTSAGSRGMAASAPSSASLPTSKRPSKEDIQFELPEGWREVPPLSVIALKSFEAGGSKATPSNVEITISEAGGDPASNVARWNSQVGGPADQASKALDQAEKLTVNGVPAEVVFVAGTEPDSRAILAAMIQWDSQSTLFVKAMGPVAAVKSQHDAFIALTKSLKW